MRAIFWTPPPPGTSPSFTSGNPNFAFPDATTRSQERTSSKPPPSAYPLTAAMTGCGQLSMARYISRPFCWNAKNRPTSKLPYPSISAPAINPLPVPVNTTTRMSGRSRSPSKQSVNSAINSSFIAFSFSSRRMVASSTSPRSSTCKYLYEAPIRATPFVERLSSYTPIIKSGSERIYNRYLTSITKR